MVTQVLRIPINLLSIIRLLAIDLFMEAKETSDFSIFLPSGTLLLKVSYRGNLAGILQPPLSPERVNLAAQLGLCTDGQR
jgi:hypothetical protein